MQRSMDSDFEDENEICYTSKRRAHPIVQHYDDDSFPSSSWTNPNENEIEEDQCSSSIDYYHNEVEAEIDDEIFNLPPSSNDLSVTPKQALHLATIYEFLRHFSQILRLSPFLFEYFCTSVIQTNDINNILFSQIHICLLRLLIKQDDDDGITYASETDIKGIIDLSFVTMDYITWPYILQLYVTSHPHLKMFTSIVKEYPFHTTIQDKIDILSALCDVALTTKTIRREFDDTKPKQHDDNCRQCQKRGDLLCCDRCEATYHLTCLNPPLTSVPVVEWFCPVCSQNQMYGVNDCIPLRENRPFYLRHRCIGHDRDQRRYWFVCRRLFVEDETGEDVRYYSTLDQFDNLLSYLDGTGPEKLLVYRLQKRYNDIARCMHITVDLLAPSLRLDNSSSMNPVGIDYAPVLEENDNDSDDQKSLSMFTDGLIPCHVNVSANEENVNYENFIDMIKSRTKPKENEILLMHSQIDGIVDNDEKDTKTFMKRRDFFVNATNNYNYSSKFNGQTHYASDSSTSNDLVPISRFNTSNRSLIEERLRRMHNIYNETKVAIKRLNDNDIDNTIWQRFEQYQVMNRYPSHSRGNKTYSTTANRPYATSHTSYPRSNYYRDYYTGNNYEDEDGMLLDNEYDDFGDDFFQQEENIDEFDMPFRKYESNRVYRGTSRGRPRGRGRPPLYGGRAGRGSHGHPPRGVNHLTTGSFQSNQRLIQPKIESPKVPEQQQPVPARNKRKPVKIKSVPISTSDDKPKRPGKVLRSGRVSRKPRRDSETDFGSDNSDDSGAKDKETGSDDDEEFDLTQLGLGFGNTSTIVNKTREGSSSSNDSLAGTNLPLTNFAAFAQSQLLATNLANGLLNTNEESSNDSDFSVDSFETDESGDILSQKITTTTTTTKTENIDDEDLDDFTYSQTMLSLIKSMQPNYVKIDLDLIRHSKTNNKHEILPSEGHLHYENYYQTNPLATRKQMLLNERDRRAHLARKFSINNSPTFVWYSPSLLLTSNYSFKNLIDILRLTLVFFENTIPLPFMHTHWKRYRYIWAKQLLDLNENISLSTFIYLLLQFESCIKSISYFDLFTDQVGYLKFRRETEKERDEAKKEEKDAFIRRKIDADSITQNVHFTRPLKHSVHKQRGEEYRLAGGQGWTFIRSTRRQIIDKKRKTTFDINSLLVRRENMSNAITNERSRIFNLLETKLKNDLDNNIENEFKNLLNTAKDDNDDFIDDLTFINYKIIDYNGSSYRYPIMLEDTSRPFHLTGLSNKKQNLSNPFQLPLPWTFSFHHEILPNIFILPSYILRRLARASMTLIDAPGFINSRLSGIGTRFGWPYPCGRPSVRTAWCYKVQTSTSFFALAHHIKYLWNCIRWNLITEKISNIDESSITTHVDNDGITTTIQVLAKRDSGPYNSYCEYFVRKTIHSQTNESSNFNIPISKSRSRAVPHPSSILAPNRLILTEQWLPERQLQPNQIKYYYQCLQEKTYKRLHRKTNVDKKKTKKKIATVTNSIQQQQQPAKPFIVRIPHLQPKSNLNTESGQVVIVKATGDSSLTNNLPIQQKSFSVVKLADGQIILVPTTAVQQNDNGISKIIKASSPPKPQLQPSTSTVPISPQERRLRPIAPAPITSIQTTNELYNSLIAQQQQQLLLQQQAETTGCIEPLPILTLNEEIPLTTISETVTINTNPTFIKPKVELTPIITQKTKSSRKSTPIPSLNDDKKSKLDPEETIRLRICEAILGVIITKIEREQNQDAIKKRLKTLTTKLPTSNHHPFVLTRLLNERVDNLRKDFVANRLNRKTALVKEQVQTQRLKQQQLILKQQQIVNIKKEESNLIDEKIPIETSITSSIKKSRKSITPKPKRDEILKLSEEKLKKTSHKRTRPLPTSKINNKDQSPVPKKVRRSKIDNTPSEKIESSDNDENRTKTRKPSSSSTTIAKMKSTEKLKKIITIKNSSNKKEKTEINLSDINCSCQRTDIQDKFFIQCELCSRWLHGTCVDLTPRQAEKLKEFICKDCTILTQKAKERLYCICQTAYDESKFYIGCDVCADWLHGSCVNISPEQAENFEVYICSRCSTDKKQEFLNKPINNAKKKDLLNLTEQLLAHKMAWPFQKPVDAKDVPNYYTIIKDPMDLTTLKTKVVNSKFKTICDYIRDVNKIFNNCRQFNPINSTFSQCANVVDNHFRQLLENLMIKYDH